METEDKIICEIKCDADCHPVGVAIAPLVDGTWAWTATNPWFQMSGRSDAKDYETLAAWLPGHLTEEVGEISSLQLRRRVDGNGWEDFDISDRRPCLRITKQAKLLARRSEREIPTGLTMHPDCLMKADLAEEYDHYLVASDASCYGDHSSWACVTGAGWVTGNHRSEHMHPTEAELWGINKAFRIYALGSPVKVITDSKDVEEIVGMINSGSTDAAIRMNYPISQADGALAAIRNLKASGTELNVSWVRRNSHELQVKADSYANQTRNSPAFRAWLKGMAPPPWRRLKAV